MVIDVILSTFFGTFFVSISLRRSENNKMKNFLFFSHSGTTFKNTVIESSPQDGSTRGLNLVLIVVVLLAIFILAIAVVFGISFFRRHQGHKNQGKFLASFPYLLIAFVFFFFKHWYKTSSSIKWHILMTECILITFVHYLHPLTEFRFQKWHNRICDSLAFLRFIQFSSNVIFNVPWSVVFKVNSSTSILWCFWFFRRPKM